VSGLTLSVDLVDVGLADSLLSLPCEGNRAADIVITRGEIAAESYHACIWNTGGYN